MEHIRQGGFTRTGLTVASIQKVIALLRAVGAITPEGAYRYDQGWNDTRVAAEMGLKKSQVAAARLANLGKTRPRHVGDALNRVVYAHGSIYRHTADAEVKPVKQEYNRKRRLLALPAPKPGLWTELRGKLDKQIDELDILMKQASHDVARLSANQGDQA
jgi:hypothetical protein